MNDAHLKRFFTLAQVIIAGIAIGIFFAVPDIVEWGRVDHFQTPLRAPMGDFEQYLTRINRLQVEGHVGDSVFTWEHKDEKTTFVFFDAVLQMAPGFSRIPALWWYVILKSISATIIFLALYTLLRGIEMEHAVSIMVSAVTVFVYGPYQLQGPATQSWFLALFLIGFAPMALMISRDASPVKVFIASVWCVVLSAVHPVFFAIGVGTSGLWWVYAMYIKGVRRQWIYAALWLVVVVGCLVAFYSSYLHVFSDAGTATAEFIERHAALRIRFPHFPLLSLKFLLLAIAAWIGYRGDIPTKRSYRWLPFIFFAAMAFVGVTQNLVTGFSYLGDHFLNVEEFIAIPLAVAFVFRKSSADAEVRGIGAMRSKGVVAVGATLFLVTALFLASELYGMSIRSSLVAGRWAPLIVAYMAISFALLRPLVVSRWEILFRRFARLLVLLGMVYAAVFLWRYYAHTEFDHISAQEHRNVLASLSLLAKGVVMAPYDLSELIALHTSHRVYWSNVNGQQAGTNEEMNKRLLDESVIFADDDRLIGTVGKFSLYGTINYWCGTLTEKVFYATLRRVGLTNSTLCNGERVEREWPEYLKRLSERTGEIERGGEWSPAYRLDWLVIEKGDAVAPRLLDKYFEKVVSSEDFTIYRFKGSSL